MRSLLCPSVLKTINSEFPSIKSKYRAEMQCFKWGRRAIVQGIMFAPFLWNVLLTENRILDYPEFLKIISTHPHLYIPKDQLYSYEQALRGKTYQSWSGWLREIDVTQRLSAKEPLSRLYYDPARDIGIGGWDLEFQTPYQTFFFAVKHEGEGTDEYQGGKDEKKAEKVIELWAPRDFKNPYGLDVVPEQTILKVLAGIPLS